MNNTQQPDTTKAVRMARALLDEGYSQDYVTNILQEKGHTAEEIAGILHSGTADVYERKLKTSRNLLFATGFCWVVSATVYFMSDHTISSTDPATGETVTASQPGGFALRFFLSLGIFSCFAVGRHIYLFVKSANNEQQKPKPATRPVSRTRRR